MSEFEIIEIDKAMFCNMVYQYHYSIIMPKITKHYLGCFQDGKLVGGISLGWGTQPKQTITKLFPTLNTRDYLEIGKMCMLDEMPRNSESMMLSKMVKWIKSNLKIQYLFTWADGIVGKPGYVYQAANFYYGGFIWTDIYISKDGEKIHPRSTREILKENAKFEGKEKLFWLTYDFCQLKGITRYRGKQFRYIYPLNKDAKELLNHSTVKWSISNFPKEIDLIWKIQTAKGEYKTVTTGPVFNKFSISTNQKNYDTNFKKDMELAELRRQNTDLIAQYFS